MNAHKQRTMRITIAAFIGILIGVATTSNNYFLTVASLVSGTIFAILVRSRFQESADEREIAIREKAAHSTYAIFAPTLVISALLLLLPNANTSGVFKNGDFLFLNTLGIIFAYLALFMIAVYAISYYFLQQKYSGGDHE